MAGKPAIEVHGAKELNRELKRMGDDVKNMTPVNREAAEAVAEAARRGVPMRSGKLRKSIKTRATKTTAGVTAGGRLVPYAGPIHFGWQRRNIEPQPFLYDALDERRTEVVGRYQDHVDELVKTLDRRTPG